jgi:spore coat polysaccharide biosynthesis protein SpsF
MPHAPPDRSGARVAGIVQARMTSSRLPGKVLADLGGRTVLAFMLARLLHSRELDAVVVATSVKPSDDAVVEEAERAGVPVVRGPLDDVLERYRLAGEVTGCEAVARMTADCPFIDPEVVDAVVARWRAGDEHYVANCVEPRTYPVGLDTEVVSWTALTAAAAEATRSYDREHVTPWVRSRPERFPPAALVMEPSFGHVRLTLDSPADLDFLRQLASRVDPHAGIGRILEILEAEGSGAP